MMRGGLWLWWGLYVIGISLWLVYGSEEKSITEQKLNSPSSFIQRYQEALLSEHDKFDENHTFPAMSIVKESMRKAQLAALSLHRKKTFIVKKVFNEKTRVLFFAGVEGSGHHAMRDVLQYCFAIQLCKNAPFSKDLFFRGAGSHGLFGGGGEMNHAINLEVVYGRMRSFFYNVTNNIPIEDNKISPISSNSKNNPQFPDFSDTSDNITPSHIYIIGLETFPNSGMMSYPNYNDARSKPVDHPDLSILAMLAESIGIDLRIIVLTRPAYDTMHSVMRRGFGNGIEGSIMVDNMQVLTEQIESLDPAFFLCLNYEELASYPTLKSNFYRETLAPFLHPILKTEWPVFDAKSRNENVNPGILLDKMWSKVRLVEHSRNNINTSSNQAKSLTVHDARRRLANNPSSAAIDEILKQVRYEVLRLQWATDSLRQLC